LALLAIFKQILLDGSTASHLADAISQCLPKDIVLILQVVIRLWLECIKQQVQIQATYAHESVRQYDPDERLFHNGTGLGVLGVKISLYDREKSRLFQMALNTDVALYHMIGFAVMIARRHTAIHSCMLEAGILSLIIVAFTNPDFPASALTGVTWKKGKSKLGFSMSPDYPLISGEAIHSEALILSVLMHRAEFRANWHEKQFNNRRYLSSLLVDLLLLADEHRYMLTRPLFKKILE